MLQCTQKRTDLQPLKVNAIYFAHNCTTGRLAVDVIACLFACVCVCVVFIILQRTEEWVTITREDMGI